MASFSATYIEEDAMPVTVAARVGYGDDSIDMTGTFDAGDGRVTASNLLVTPINLPHDWDWVEPIRASANINYNEEDFVPVTFNATATHTTDTMTTQGSFDTRDNTVTASVRVVWPTSTGSSYINTDFIASQGGEDLTLPLAVALKITEGSMDVVDIDGTLAQPAGATIPSSLGGTSHRLFSDDGSGFTALLNGCIRDIDPVSANLTYTPTATPRAFALSAEGEFGGQCRAFGDSIGGKLELSGSSYEDGEPKTISMQSELHHRSTGAPWEYTVDATAGEQGALGPNSISSPSRARAVRHRAPPRVMPRRSVGWTRLRRTSLSRRRRTGPSPARSR